MSYAYVTFVKNQKQDRAGMSQFSRGSICFLHPEGGPWLAGRVQLEVGDRGGGMAAGGGKEDLQGNSGAARSSTVLGEPGMDEQSESSWHSCDVC
jgi:hypothetical protein